MSLPTTTLLLSILLVCPCIQVGCTQPPNVHHDDGRVWLDDISPAKGNGNGYLRGLEAILARERTPVSYERLMGLSGIAFILQADSEHLWDGKIDVGWWPLDPWGLKLRKEFLAQAIGRELKEFGWFYDSHHWGPISKDLPTIYREQIQRPLERHINSGKGALATFCPTKSEFGFVINGYDSATGPKSPIWGHCAVDQTDHWDRCADWPFGVILIGKAIPALDRDEADLAALRYAVSLSRDQAGPTEERWRHRRFTGQKAFAAWAAVLRQVEKPTNSYAHVNVRVNLIRNRSAAIAFLRDVASRQIGAAEELGKSADAYEAVIRQTDLLNHSGLAESPDRRRKMADQVERIAAADRQAIRHIERALAQLSAQAVQGGAK